MYNDVEIKRFGAPLAYPDAIAPMEQRVEAVVAGKEAESLWLLEHTACYTAGTSAHTDELLSLNSLPVYPTGRGGRYTYHGPGQRVCYAMLNLKTRFDGDIRAYVAALERWIILVLAEFNLAAFTRKGRTGVWVSSSALGGEAKIAAIGIRVKRWVSYHGVAINLEPDLAAFSGIVPCGISGFGVTSLRHEGIIASMDEMDAALLKHLPCILGFIK